MNACPGLSCEKELSRLAAPESVFLRGLQQTSHHLSRRLSETRRPCEVAVKRQSPMKQVLLT